MTYFERSVIKRLDYIVKHIKEVKKQNTLREQDAFNKYANGVDIIDIGSGCTLHTGPFRNTI